MTEPLFGNSRVTNCARCGRIVVGNRLCECITRRRTLPGSIADVYERARRKPSLFTRVRRTVVALGAIWDFLRRTQ